MMMPSIFGENLFDDFMDFPFDREFFGRSLCMETVRRTL